MASPETIRSLNAALESVRSFREKDLITRSDWGKLISFEDAKVDIDLALSIADDLSNMPLEYLPEGVAANLSSYLPPVFDVLSGIDGIGAEGDVHQKHDQLVATLRSAVETLQLEAAPWIAYLAYRRGDVEANMRRLREVLGEADGELTTAKEHAEGTAKELGEIVDAAREAAASTGVATFTHAFREEAETISRKSKGWLGAAIVGASATIVVAAGSFFWPPMPDQPDAWESARLLFTKLSVVAVLLTATVWCARLYRALRHLEAVNRHRALSLQTFQAFVKSSPDARTKDAVLMAATNSIFDSVATGLVDQAGGQKAPAVQFVEIGRSGAKQLTPSSDPA